MPSMVWVWGLDSEPVWPFFVVIAESWRISFGLLGSCGALAAGGGVVESSKLPRFFLMSSGFWPVTEERKSIV